MSNPDRLDVEALREVVHKLEGKASLEKVEDSNEKLRRCQEIWDKDFEVLIFSIRKVIADKVPQDLRLMIVRQCINNVIALLTPVETAGILASITYKMFENKAPQAVMMGGSVDLAKLLGIKDNGTDKTAGVV